MNRAELVEEIALKTGKSKKDTDLMLHAFMEAVAGALEKTDKVLLVGFGCFEVKEKSARRGVYPGTKEPMEIPAMRTPVFKPGKQLKERINHETR